MTSSPLHLAPAVRWQAAIVTGIIPRTPRIKSFVFELSRPFGFLAGQHVDVRLTAPDGYRAMRSYSIASTPGEATHIELAVERLENGEISDFFHDVVVVGDKIELRGPLGGYFIWSAADGGPLLLAGGGSGVVPLMAMIREREREHEAPGIPVALVFSARTWDDVLNRDELFELADRRDGFNLLLTLTRESPRRAGDYGRRIDASIVKTALADLPSKPKYVFICGSNPFVNTASDAALAAGVPASIIRTERYGI